MNESHMNAALDTTTRPEVGMGLPPAVPATWDEIFILLFNLHGTKDLDRPGRVEYVLGEYQRKIESREAAMRELEKENQMDLARIAMLKRWVALHQLPERFVKKDYPEHLQKP